MSTAVVSRQTRLLFWGSAASVWVGNVWLMHHWHALTGQAAGDSAMAFDVLVMLPALYLWLHRSRGWKAWLGASGVFGIGLLVGRALLPPQHLLLWDWLPWLRWIISGGMVLVEFVMAAWIVRTLWRMRGDVNRELELDKLLHAALPEANGVQMLMRMEARMWLFALSRRPIRSPYPGLAHFTVHAQNGNASSQQAFLLLMLIELPIMHLLLHFAWNPKAAIIVSMLSVYGWLWLLAEYRATLQRPISLDQDAIQIRYGIFTDMSLPLAAIRSITTWQGGALSRRRGRIRCYGMGAPNVHIRLFPETRLAAVIGSSEIDEVLLGVDEPAGFINTISQALVRRMGGAEGDTHH